MQVNEVNVESEWLHVIYMEALISAAVLPIVAVCFGLEPDEWMKLCCRLPTVSQKKNNQSTKWMSGSSDAEHCLNKKKI